MTGDPVHETHSMSSNNTTSARHDQQDGKGQATGHKTINILDLSLMCTITNLFERNGLITEISCQ